MKRFSIYFLLSASAGIILFFVVGCSERVKPLKNTPGRLAGIRISPAHISTYPASSIQFVARGISDEGEELVISPSWSCSAGKIDSRGRYLTPARPCQATVYAELDGVVAHSYVDVVDLPVVSRIEVTPARLKSPVSTCTLFRGRALDSKGESIEAEIRWDSTIGHIEANGLFMAPRRPGKGIVTARVRGVSATVEVEVEPGEPFAMEILPAERSIKASSITRLRAIGWDSEANMLDLVPSWYVNHGTIRPDGVFLAPAYTAEVEVTATYRHLSARTGITVY